MGSTNSSPLRAVVVGCGQIGAAGRTEHSEVGILTHAHALSESEKTELVGLSDRNPAALISASREYHVERSATFSNSSDLLAAIQPDFVSIATPDSTHFELASQVVRCPGVRAILVEKPLALSSKEGKRLVESANDSGIKIAVNFSRRYAPVFQMLRKRIGEGEFGKLQTVMGCYTKGIFHNGSHWIDLLRFLTGEEIHQVRALPKFDRESNDPTPDVDLLLGHGAVARLAGCDKDSFTIFEMDILGTSGRIQILDSGHKVEISKPKASERNPGYHFLHPLPGETVIGGLKNVMLNAVEDLADAWNTGREPLSPARDAIVPIKVGEAVIASLRGNGKWHAVD